ncbi:MAG: guanylate kinase [Synergistaceae bacterium]|jgi:guanylate kinase
MRGRLFVFSGPSGAGKNTVLKEAIPLLGNISYSISCTTRKPRPEDVDGETYFFLDEAVFKDMISKGMFLEYAKVHGNLYGTRRDMVESELEKGRDVLLEIDVQGAIQIKESMKEAITIFIMPSSAEELERRLRKRGTESEEEIQLRIKNAQKEQLFADKYDHIVINNNLNDTVEKFVDIVKGYRGESK